MLGQLMESLSGNSQYIILILIATVTAMAVTFIINMTSKRLKFVKYLPGLILLFAGIFTLILVLNVLFERSSLTNILIALIAITSGVCSLLFALCLGIYNKDRYPKREIERK